MDRDKYESHPQPYTIVSVPALAAAMRTIYTPASQSTSYTTIHTHSMIASGAGPVQQVALPATVGEEAIDEEFHWYSPTLRRIVPPYQIKGQSIDEEAQSAANVVKYACDRLHRLGAAYGEWKEFDASAYFDLSAPQTSFLVSIKEHVGMVQIVFFADLLLPSFQKASQFCTHHLSPAYYTFLSALTERPDNRFDDEAVYSKQKYDAVYETMCTHWQRLSQVVRQTQNLLGDHIDFLTTNGVHEERLRWQQFWLSTSQRTQSSYNRLLPVLHDIPSLTLSFNFPLPASRQVGRIKRLRKNRAWHKMQTKWQRQLTNSIFDELFEVDVGDTKQIHERKLS
ncbi:MAG: hypothetical protein AAF639_01685 [Chloroflexota bacterium]